MNPEYLAGTAAAIVAVLIELLPPLKVWWDERFNAAQKQVVIALVVVVISLLTAMYKCRYNGICPESTDKFVVDTLILAFASFAGAVVGHGSTNKIGDSFSNRYQDWRNS